MLSEDVRTINDQVVIQKDPIHSCFACPKVFTHKWMLERHMLTHTGEQPFACSICLRKFSLQASCLRHVRHVHKNVGGLISNYVVKASDLETENTQPSMQCWKDTKQNYWELKKIRQNVGMILNFVVSRKKCLLILQYYGYDDFEDVSGKRKSAVWEHFFWSKSREVSKCHHCSKVMKNSGGSTKCLINHLMKMHSIKVAVQEKYSNFTLNQMNKNQLGNWKEHMYFSGTWSWRVLRRH